MKALSSTVVAGTLLTTAIITSGNLQATVEPTLEQEVVPPCIKNLEVQALIGGRRAALAQESARPCKTAHQWEPSEVSESTVGGRGQREQ